MPLAAASPSAPPAAAMPTAAAHTRRRLHPQAIAAARRHIDADHGARDRTQHRLELHMPHVHPLCPIHPIPMQRVHERVPRAVRHRPHTRPLEPSAAATLCYASIAANAVSAAVQAACMGITRSSRALLPQGHSQHTRPPSVGRSRIAIAILRWRALKRLGR